MLLKIKIPKLSHTFFLFLVLMAISLLSCSASKVDKDGIKPTYFNAYIGGFLGNSYRVEWRDGKLIYTTFDLGNTNPKERIIEPTGSQWKEFREELYHLNIWQWHQEYSNKNIEDGTQWSLNIIYDDHSLKTDGSNNYPDANGKPNGKPEYTETFDRYLNAVEKLIGGEFR